MALERISTRTAEAKLAGKTSSKPIGPNATRPIKIQIGKQRTVFTRSRERRAKFLFFGISILDIH
jgi:hypothetical protein